MPISNPERYRLVIFNSNSIPRKFDCKSDNDLLDHISREFHPSKNDEAVVWRWDGFYKEFILHARLNVYNEEVPFLLDTKASVEKDEWDSLIDDLIC